jgi:cobalt transporter subunit CbtA
MIFTRIIYSAVLIGMATGLLLSLMQNLTLDPIIFQAESYEISKSESAVVQGHESHDHEHSGWAPADGSERTIYTVLSNMSAGIGFSAVILALMSQFWLPKQRTIKPQQSLLWGVAGFAALYLAPGIGLPAEIPGIQAAPVEQRQIWWALTAICVAIGLGILAWAQVKLKAIGLLFLAIPYLVGAPSYQGPEFAHPDPAAVEVLTKLHQQFIITSGIVNLLFWIALGLACGAAFNRWFRPAVLADEHPA